MIVSVRNNNVIANNTYFNWSNNFIEAIIEKVIILVKGIVEKEFNHNIFQLGNKGKCC